MEKILCITDLHKVGKDTTAIRGRVTVQQKIQRELIEYIKHNGITHVILLGDWYDRGFHDLCAAYGAFQEDRQLSDAVNGNVYLCIGNHFYLERDDNPEMYLIQPSPFMKTKTEITMPDKPVFQVVNQLTFGHVQISFFHYSKVHKEYVATRKPEIKYHIGIYHDDCTLPTDIKQREGIMSETSSAYLNTIYDNIDLAIHGHIHSRIGVQPLQLISGKSVPLVVPGSLGITANSERYKHSSVNLPIITIDDDNVSVSFEAFSTHIEDLQFYSKAKTKTQSIMPTDTVNITTQSIFNLQGYLQQKGYSDNQLEYVDKASKSDITLSDAIMALKVKV